MNNALVHSRAIVGIEALPVAVEVHLGNGLPCFNIVGLPETVVRESKDRVRSALLTSGFEFPSRRITVNLAPADLPKEGARFDLPIAVGLLVASQQLSPERLDGHELIGELALSGALRPCRGALPATVAAHRAGRAMMLARDNADEAALARAATVLPADSLIAVTGHLHGHAPLQPLATPGIAGTPPPLPDLADVRGQHQARRALEIAAAGGHHLLLIGPPGAGKTMLAERLPGILPPLHEDEALEVAIIDSLTASGGRPALPGRRPFRAPHHGASAAAVVGGGAHPRPGEISAAHRGVLFLDELPEFDRRVLEALREPLESRRITVARAAGRVTFPADFQLVAAMNPCPCGRLGQAQPACQCTTHEVSRYQRRVSAPLLDRIDLQLEVPALPRADLLGESAPGEPSDAVRGRVCAARERALRRAGMPNATLPDAALERDCALDDPARGLLGQAVERLGLSARGVQRARRVARTIADLADCAEVRLEHLGEALGYRQLERSALWVDAAGRADGPGQG